MPPLPKGWALKPLGAIATTSAGGTPNRKHAKYYGGPIPWLKSGELNDGTVLYAEESITDSGLNESSAKLFPAGTLCIALYGATVGRLGILGLKCATNQAICGIFLSEGVETKFTFFYLRSIRQQLIDLGKGGAQPNISSEIVRNIDVPVPPRPEQRRIVAKIEQLFSHLDAAEDSLKRIREKLKQYRAAVLKAAVEGKLTEQWRADHPNVEPADKLLKRILTTRRQKWEEAQQAKFDKTGKPPPKNWRDKYEEPAVLSDTSTLPKLPKGWCWTSLNSIANIQLGKMLSPKAFSTELSMLPYLRNVNVRWFTIDVDDVKSMGFTKVEVEKFKLQQGDLLICEGGEPGRCSVVGEGASGMMFQKALLRVRPIAKGCDTRHIQYVLKHFIDSGTIIERRSETTIQHLPLEKTEQIPIPLPPLRELELLVQEVEAQMSSVEKQEQMINLFSAKFTNLRQSILKRAFEGKLVPQDPTDEPAEKLLERIRAHRATPAQKNSPRGRPAKPRTPASSGKCT